MFRGIKIEPYILFLGTGGDEVIIGKQIRRSGGIIVNTDNLRFHINPGPGALNCLKENNVNVRETSAILVSNLKQKYCAGTMSLIEAMTINGLDVKGIFVANDLSIKGNNELLPVISPYHRKLMERIIIMSEGQRLGVGSTEVVALPCKNDIDSLGFKIISESFNLAYLPDTDYSAKFRNYLKDLDILILSLSIPFGFEKENFLNAENAVKIINEVKPRLVVITGFGVKMIKEDPKLIARELHRQTKTQIIAAQDGLVLKPLSYVSKKVQKRLNSY